MKRKVNIATASLVARLNPIPICLTLLVVCSLCIPVRSQNGATVTGLVTDELNANVAGAEVRLRSRTGMQLFGRTNESGIYKFTGLGSGEYVVEVSARGFSTVTSDSLVVERGKAVKLDFQLPIAAINENVVVIASGTPQRADEVSKAVTVLEDQQIETKRELTLAESLRGTPGIRVQQQGSPGAVTTLRLRGQRNSDTAIMLDGLRVRDSSDINGSILPFIPDFLPSNLDRVEVLRGSGSSIYGTNAIGGVINLVPKTGTGRPHFEFSAEGGSLALSRERIQGSGGIGTRAGFSFGLSRLDVRRGVDGEDQYGNTAAVGRFHFNPTPSITIGANFYGTLSNSRVNDSPFSLPAAFTSTDPFPDAVEGTTFHPDFNNPDQGRRNRLLVGSARLTQRINEMFSYTVAYQRVSSKRRNYNGAAIDPRFAAFYPFGDFEFLSHNRGLIDILDGRVNLRLGRKNLITAGFEFERESLFQNFISAFGGDPATTDRQRTFAIFGQDQMFFFDDRLQVSVAIRGQSYSIRAADRPGFLSDIEAKGSVTGDGSIAYFFRETNTKLRAHVGNGFRAPSLFERFGNGTFGSLGFTRFGDPTIRAEQSISVDGGVDQRIANNKVMFGITYFYTRLQRAIEFTEFQSFFNPTAPPDPLGLGRTGGYLNRIGGLSRGIESYVEAAPTDGMSLRASYTFTNSDRFVPLLGMRPEYVTPRHLFGVNISHRYRAFLFDFDLNHTGRYLAPVFSPAFQRAELTFDGYTKADLFGSYERPINERTRIILYMGADNLFNAKYFENGFRAPGALGRGGVKVQF